MYLLPELLLLLFYQQEQRVMDYPKLRLNNDDEKPNNKDMLIEKPKQVNKIINQQALAKRKI